MLVGREPERRAISALLAAARVGQGGVLLLTGEAGMGKTALLEDALEAAVGMRVLRAAGSEAESSLPFGALLQLLRPALEHLDRLPAPQAEALASALALRPGTGGDRFAVGAATLTLLSRLADDTPVAVLVDDAHLLDLPSAQALVFAARRLGADRVALLATARGEAAGPFATAGTPVLPLAGLSLTETAQLLRGADSSGGGTGRLDAAALARLHALTGGNPLAVAELAGEVHALAAAPPGSPVELPASLGHSFARRLDRLSAAARTALLVAAAGPADLGAVSRACRLLGVDLEDLEEAEDADLLRVDATAVRFRHGLVRSAAWSAAAP
ncbi:MAG: transcriptional regulator, LuxR family, partial [Frankiales bacterium]|nr:transcriptional regulator, LuxR family [Frankiales bacterium]